jgi:hypothetical protein
VSVGLDAAEALSLGAANKIALPGAAVGASAKLARKVLEPEPEPAYRVVGERTGLSGGDFGLTSELILPTAYADAVQLNLTPFISNVGSYLQSKGVIPDNDLVALGVDLAADFGNLLPFAGQLTAATKATSRARLISRALSGGTKGTSGEALVDGLVHMVETAGKVGKVADEVLEAGKAGNKAAIDEIIEAAMKAKDVPEEAAKIAAALRKDKKALVALMENLDAIGKIPELPGRAFLQESRVSQIAADQRTSRLATIPLNRAWRDPAAFARQAFLGITYEGERFLMPAANAVAGAMDKIAPLKGIPVLEKGLRVVPESVIGAEKVALREAAERMPGGITVFERDRMMTRARLLVALPNEEQLAGLADGITPEQVKALIKQSTGKKAVMDEEVQRVTEGIIAKIKGGKATRDAAILQMRDEAVTAATSRATAQWESVNMLDSALAQSDMADLRNWYATFRDDWILGDPQGVGMALMGRAGAGDRLLSAMSQADTEIIRNILPVKADAEAVISAIDGMVTHPDLFELRDGRAFLTASPERVREEAPLFFDLLTVRGYDGFEQALRETGLHPEITHLVASYRDVLDGAKDVLAHEGVVLGFLSDYFPRTGKFTPEGLKAMGLDTRTMGRFLDVAVERHAAGQPDEVVDIVFGKPNAQGVRPLMALLNQSAAGKLTLQETRRFSEKMLKRMVDRGWYEPGRDGIAALTTYLSSAHKSILVNKVWRDLPELPTRVMRSELEAIAGKAKAGLVTDDQLAGLRRFYKDAGAVPEWARRLGIFDEMTGNTRHFETGESLTERQVNAYMRGMAASEIKAARRAAEQQAVAEMAGETVVGKHKVRGLDSPMEATAGERAIPIEEAWVRSGSVPSRVDGAAQIGKAIRKRKKALFDEAVGEIARKKLEKAGAPAGTKPKMLVFKADSGKITEAFDLWRKSDYNGFANKYDEINAGIKSVVLLGDLFYFNALAAISVATDPKAIGRVLLDDLGELRRAPASIPGALGRAAIAPIVGGRQSNAVAQAAVGAAAGLGAAPVFEAEDAQQAAGFALAGALYGAMLGTALKKGRDARRVAFNPMNTDSLFWAGQGTWRGRPDDRAIGVMTGFLRRHEEAMIRKAGGAIPTMAGILRATRHAVEDYEDTLFGVLHNGGVQAAFDINFRPRLEALRKSAEWAGLTEQEQFYKTKQLATEIMGFANTAFSSQRYSLLFKDPHAEKMLSRAFIAPQWLTSRLNLAASMLGNMGPLKGALLGSAAGSMVELVETGFDPEGLSRGPAFGAAAGAAAGWWSRGIVQRMGVQGDVYRNMSLRLSGSALVGGWAVYNLLNYAFTGHWMHENEEGRKLAVQLPNGQYYDPGKPFTEAYEWMGVMDKQTFEAPVFSRLASKLAPIPASFRVVLNRNYWGGAIIEAEDGPTAILGKYAEIVFQSTAPIGLRSTGEAAYQGVFGEGLDTGDLNRSLAGMAGLPIKGKATGQIPGGGVNPLMLRAIMGPSLGDVPNVLAGSL